MTNQEINEYVLERHNILSNVEFNSLMDRRKTPQIIGYEFKSDEGLFGTHYIWTDDGQTWGLSVYQENEDEIVKPFQKKKKTKRKKRK